MSKAFPVIEIEGEAFDRGVQYGRLCADRIRATLAFYRSIFTQTPRRLEELGHAYNAAIALKAPELSTELYGISVGAGVRQSDLALLNARSEVLGGPECTSLALPAARLLGQTWDWAKRMESLAVLLRVKKPDGRVLQMLVEPGMLGKIGMNSDGLGVCINFLHGPEAVQPGVPFHVLTRMVLEERSLERAVATAYLHARGAIGHLLIADDAGRAVSMELAGEQRSVVRGERLLCHTNHYLRVPGPEGRLARWESGKRLARIAQLAASVERPVLADLQRMLSDTKGLCPINGRYWPTLDKGMVGTVAVVAMDLGGRTFTVRRCRAKAARTTVLSVK